MTRKVSNPEEGEQESTTKVNLVLTQKTELANSRIEEDIARAARKKLKTSTKPAPKNNPQKLANTEDISDYIKKTKKRSSRHFDKSISDLIRKISTNHKGRVTLKKVADYILKGEGEELRRNGPRYIILLLGYLIESGVVEKSELSPFECSYLGLPEN